VVSNRPAQPIPTPNAAWSSREAYLLGLACLLAGLAMGYLIRGSSQPFGDRTGAPTVPAGAAQPATTSAPLPTAQTLQPLAAPLLAAIKAEPKNADALVELGNLYYDHRVYPEAITYYRRALELRPNDVNVRTDLGTAYWYSGLPKQALAEYQKALAVQPNHAPTLLNMGIVKMEGLQDYAGAIAAWEKLLATSPDHPEKPRVLSLIAQAKARQK
jgi:tetratricopeptide (TPR) repeat protein